MKCGRFTGEDGENRSLRFKTMRSIVEVGSIFFLLGVVAGFNKKLKSNYGSKDFRTRELSRIILNDLDRSLFSKSDNKNNNDIDDDITRDKTCKEYLRNFLNETTDATDECQGMYNAYQAADCVDDSHLHADKKEATDDVLIDDFYENWECCSSIYDYYESHCQETGLDSNRLLGIVIVMVACGFCKTLIRTYNVQWIPDAAACILVGAMAGLLGRIINPSYVTDKLTTFNNDLFLHILLPPIIFEAALTIDKRSFRRHVFPILSFAILGTLLSSIVIGIFTYFASDPLFKKNDRIQLPFLDSFLFGSLISSIDPVATLGILSSVGLDQRDTLYTLVFGESLLNDGIAIVLFDTLVKHLGDVTPTDMNNNTTFAKDNDEGKMQYVDQETINEIISNFFIIAGGSIVIGVVCGCICTLYFYYLRGKHNPVTEVSIFFTWALIPFYLSDTFNLSGIISVMVMGFVLDYFVIGGFENEEREWIDYIALRCNQDNTNPQQLQQEQQQTSNNTSNHQFFNLFNNNNDNTPYNNTIATNPYTRNTLKWEQIYTSCYVAFSGRGHLLNRSKQHVNFVAEVISTIMETAIFAYLGLFLFNDINMWNIRLNTISIVGCILSRAIMVLVISAVINIFVYFNIENNCFRRVLKCCKQIFYGIHGGGADSGSHRRQINLNNSDSIVNTQPSYTRLLNEYDNVNSNIDNDIDNNPLRDDADEDDDDIDLSTNCANITSRQYLDRKTQLILLLAGVRGAVSFALVCHIPVYDAVTKQGSHYKAELKAMTSSSIFFTIFVFGALTYFVVHQETNGILNANNNNINSNNVTNISPFIHNRRLNSSALASRNSSTGSGCGSDDEQEQEITPQPLMLQTSPSGTSFLEIERPPNFHQ